MLKNRKDLPIYGLEWGDNATDPQLTMVRDHFLRANITPETTVLEIGPGGGRWTRYMLDAKRVIVVDPFQEMLDEHARTIDDPKIERIRNNGTDFPGVAEGSVDFVFSFGVFVHLEIDVLEAYLKSLHAILHEGSKVFIHYADKTKRVAFTNKTFGATYPSMVRALLEREGYMIVAENTTAMNHSAMVLFQKNTMGHRHFPSGALPELPADLYPVIQ